MTRDSSKHAATRGQQRGIAPLVVDWLLMYGHRSRHRGADVYFLDKKARRTLRRDIGDRPYKRMEPLLDVYVVVSDDGAIITTAHRTRRLNRSS